MLIAACIAILQRTNIATKLQLYDWRIGVQFPTREEIFLFSAVSSLALGATLPPVHWVQGEKLQLNKGITLPFLSHLDIIVPLYSPVMIPL
jgi:hypothetical protein